MFICTYMGQLTAVPTPLHGYRTCPECVLFLLLSRFSENILHAVEHHEEFTLMIYERMWSVKALIAV